MERENMPRQLQIELPPDVAEGIYANFAVITHSPSEFVIDFARMVPGAPKAKVQGRIIMTPMNAKMLLKALEDNIGKFEANFGEIKTPDKHPNAKGQIGFSNEPSS
ncbi:MAG TPA: DUF3467 domain-containing protein [candidate division Zixibacteria bacterium]|nr:DUF3467 domain-containing protein [candidate division Zixibacteria bacterium]